ncbi:MAG: HAMP domain-containing protein [Chloroflexi bacterium]|nr:HAMP domain-containing protein [Chloroflexota bacterium]
MRPRNVRLLRRVNLPAKIGLGILCILVLAGGVLAYFVTQAMRQGREWIMIERLAISDVIAAYEDAMLKKAKAEVAEFAASADATAPEQLWKNIPLLDRLLDAPGYEIRVLEAFHVNADGRVVHSMATPAPELDADPLIRRLVSQAVKDGPAVNAVSTAIEGMPVAFVSAPSRESGLFVIGIGVGKAILSGFDLHAWMLGTSGRVELVGSDGKVMARIGPLDPSVSTRASGDEQRLADLMSGIEHQGFSEYPNFGENGSIIGQEVIAVTKVIEAPWAVVVRQSAAEVYAPVASARDQLVAVALAILLLSLVVVTLLSRHIVSRLGRLVKASNAMAGGDLDAPLADLGGDEVGMVARAMDRMRRSLKQANAEAAAKAREAEKTSATLAAEKMKTDFLSSVSHQLRTPLSSVKACVTSLLRPDARFDSATTKEFLDEVDRRSDELDNLITKLLQTARIEGDAIRLVKDLILLPKIAETVCAEVSSRNPGLSFHCEFPKEFPPVEGDQGYIEHVFRNYLENAAKYSPNGGAIIVSGDVNEKEVVVSVRDEGSGIPPPAAEKLFERFYRADSEANRTVKGLGLGLYIVKAIVSAHGGRVWFTSEPGKGSTFFFSLPYEPRTSRLPGED